MGINDERYSGCVLYLAHRQAPVPRVRNSPTLTCWPAGPRMRSGIVVALPLTAVSSQFVIGSFEARFFAQAYRRTDISRLSLRSFEKQNRQQCLSCVG
jgi:hypothetical protein